ncbi:MAG: hypothetical protein ACHQT8_04570 [Chlamydiales bacterium]
MAATLGGLTVAGGARFVISQQAGLSTPVGLTYNLVDMVVSGLFALHFRDANALITPQQLLIARISGVIAGLVVTGLLFGPMSPLVAIALNIASLAIDMLAATQVPREQILIV